MTAFSQPSFSQSWQKDLPATTDRPGQPSEVRSVHEARVVRPTDPLLSSLVNKTQRSHCTRAEEASCLGSSETSSLATPQKVVQNVSSLYLRS